MNLSIEIFLKNKFNRYEKKYEIFNDTEKTKFIITSSLKESFNKVITNVDAIKKDLEEIPEKIVELNKNNPFDANIFIIESFIRMDDEKIIEILKNIDEININGDIVEIKKYIDKNKLNNKKIIINEQLKLNENKIYDVINTFDGYNNVYIMLEGNKNLIRVNELKDTINIIDNYIFEVKKYNFSPLEEIMYLYDLIRDRVVLEEDKSDDKRISRDLSKALLGDKIVCEGFSNIYKAILKKLGYNIMNCKILKNETVNGKRIAHLRNIIHLVDKKYNIDGIYEIDVTWGSKKNVNDTSYLNSYKYFLKTRKDMELLKKGKYTDITFPYYTEDLLISFKNMLEKGLVEQIPKDVVDTVNEISRFVDGKTLISPIMLIKNKQFLPRNLQENIDYEYIIDRLIYYDKLFNNPISANELLNALLNVRKIEYYNNPLKYPFDKKTLYLILLNSKWVFKGNMSGLLLAIYGCLISEKLTIDTKINFEKITKELELDKKIESIKLCKTLRNINDNNFNK